MCIRDRGKETMKKLKEFREKYDVKNWRAFQQKEARTTKTRLRAKVNETLSSTVVFGMRVRSSLCNDHMMSDLYEILSPFVGRIRGECGLAESPEAFLFRPLKTTRRRSQSRSQVNVISVQKQISDDQVENIPRMAYPNKAEALHHLMVDWDAMLRSRGLLSLEILINGRQNAQKRSFWSQEASLFNTFGTASWSELLTALTSSALCVLPHRNFETRVRRRKTLALREFFESALVHSATQLIHNVRSSVVRNSMGMRRKLKRELPNDWPIIPFVFEHLALEGNLHDIRAAIPEMNTSKKRIKLEAQWHVYTGDLSSKIPIATNLFAKVVNLVDLSLSLDMTNFNDYGCKAVSELLESSCLIVNLTLWMGWTKITDVGLSCLASQVSSLPLRCFQFACQEYR
eukprot:TRINITY_DN6029_c0_g1_i2.p1 TRINITY_DN6029_c0_g1~~TRINITY_DN6029_c0_g1_i2.p1  ORF type:complete len:401 (-),score=57.55 TRINITY_DN6029_c0_g1_i2:82-1284(-)